MTYRALAQFASLFEGKLYNHRRSTLGDSVATEVYEDLYDLDPMSHYRDHVDSRSRVLNRANTQRGVPGRRGDGTFGQIVPMREANVLAGHRVARGETATIEVGVEVKILAKAMMKQIDRVIGDLNKQVVEFRRGGGRPICVGVVGVNFAPQYTSVEGERTFTTDGKRYPHPAQEAANAIARLREHVAPNYDELILLRFTASNVAPFPFGWTDRTAAEGDYGAALTRVLRKYETHF